MFSLIPQLFEQLLAVYLSMLQDKGMFFPTFSPQSPVSESRYGLDPELLPSAVSSFSPSVSVSCFKPVPLASLRLVCFLPCFFHLYS